MALNAMDFNQYQIGDLDLRTIGFIPGRGGSQNIAISGHLDVPVRTGRTHYVWAEDSGIEAYVRPDEIFFAGRDITIEGYVVGDSREDLYDKIESINQKLNSMNGEFPLACKWGEWDVTVVRIEVTRIQKGAAECKLVFREAKPDLEGAAPASASGGYGLDGYSWGDLGVIKLKTAKELNRGESRMLETSVFGFEKNRVKGFEPISIDLEFFVRNSTYAGLSAVIKNFGALVSGPHSRILALEDGSYRECFSKDGMTVRDIRVTSSESYAFINLKLTEVRRFKNYAVMGDDEGFALGDSTGQALAFIV